MEVLTAIGAEAPEWRITGPSLRDQGASATVLLGRGITPAQIRHALLSRPLPTKLTHSVAAVIGRRLSDLAMEGPPADRLIIPTQPSGASASGTDETPTPRSWEEEQQRLDAAVEGRTPLRNCAGDDGLCPRLALPGSDLCASCAGRPAPKCAAGCERTVFYDGATCLVCADSRPDAEDGTCPGFAEPCGRPVQTIGLCGRCRIRAEEAKRAADEEWERLTAAATAAVAAEEARQPAEAPF